MSNENCPTCGKGTGKNGHMCIPTQHNDEKCDWCGSMIADSRHVCSDKLKEMSYICNSCGRTAISEEDLCDPDKIK